MMERVRLEGEVAHGGARPISVSHVHTLSVWLPPHLPLRQPDLRSQLSAHQVSQVKAVELEGRASSDAMQSRGRLAHLFHPYKV
jgi:hypothetical protein